MQVHNMVLKEHANHTAVCTWLNSRLEVLNASRTEKLSPFNSANFSVHFEKHIPDVLHMVQELNSAIQTNNALTEADHAVAEAVLVSAGMEYQKMAYLVDEMEANLIAYSDMLKLKRETKQATGREIKNYSDFVSSYLEARERLSKLTSREKNIVSALDLTVKLVVTGLATRTVKIAEEVRDFLAAELRDDAVPDMVLNMIKSRSGGEMRTLVHETLDQVKREFGING
jgi:hypothetical protein